MRGYTTALCLLLGVLVQGSSGADTPQMSCNITTDFALELVGCVIKPFTDFLNIDPFLERMSNGGHDFHPFKKYTMGSQAHILNDLKKAKGVQDIFKVVGGFEQTEFDKVRERLNPQLKNTDEDENMKISMREYVLQQIINNVDFDEVADHLLLQMIGVAGALRSPMTMTGSTPDQQIKFPWLGMSWNATRDIACTSAGGGSIGSVAKRICSMMRCLPTFKEAALQDDIKFARCFFECQDLPIISQCMHNAFEGCEVKVLFKLLKINLDWIGDLITRVMVDYLEFDHCVLDVKDAITIEEGKTDTILEVKQWLPPGVHCFSKTNFMNTPLGVAELLVQFIYGNMGDCNVTLEISDTNYVRDLLTQRVPSVKVPGLPVSTSQNVFQSPMCRSGQAIPQVLIGWHQYANETSGIIPMTYENFNETMRIPITATIDNKVEINEDYRFYPEDFIQIKIRAGLLTKDSTMVEVTRDDRDSLEFRSCWVINGPHVRTFDSHYYYNLYEGHFVMYGNKKLSYEVQIVNQLCPGKENVTCTCAASVRSGNDVFSVDACRRKGQDPKDVIRKVTLYLIGDLSHGTRIFRRDQGLTYKVLLPHGTLVTISSTDNKLNVLIRPSAYDGNQNAQGLCGNFDGDANSDLFLRNGSVYTGPGTDKREQPSDFITDWRVEKEDIILWGATDKHTTPELLKYCSCSHVLLMGAHCSCGYNMLASDCDIGTDGELPDLFPMISRNTHQAHLSYDGPGMVQEDMIDFDDSYTTTDYTWDPEKETQKLCDKRIMEDPVITKCKPLVKKIRPFLWNKWKAEFTLYKDACEEDAQMNSDTNWGLSARMAARQHCYDLLDHSSYFFEDQIRELTNIDCPNDCSPHLNSGSTCVNGTCICDEQHHGPDCSIEKADRPDMAMPTFSPCDTRSQNCSYATVYGKNFVQDKVFCHINKTKETLAAHVLSTSQISCRLPDASGGNPAISVTHIAPKASSNADLYDTKPKRDTSKPFGVNGFEFVPYDSLCHNVSEFGEVKERTEEDHCLVKAVCYNVNQTSAADECYVCNPETDRHQLQYSTSQPCTERKEKQAADEQAARKERNLRIIFSCLMCGAVVIITVVVFLVSRSKNNKKAKHAEPKTLGNGNIPGQANAAFEMESSPQNKEDPLYINIGEEDTTDSPEQTQEEPTMASSSSVEVPGQLQHPPDSINPREMAEFWRIKHLAAERSRTRTNSQGSRASGASIGSTGIGGSGPSHYAGSRMRTSTNGSYGMGAGAPIGNSGSPTGLVVRL